MEWEEELRKTIVSVTKKIPDGGILLFSGGLDSSLLAFLASIHGKQITLFSVGTVSSHDKSWTHQAASIIGLPLEFREIGENEVISGLKEIKRMFQSEDALTLLIELPSYFACKYSERRSIVSGQGSDELFLGYRKYDLEDTSKMDLERVMNKLIPMEKEMGKAFNKEFFYPYLEGNVISVAEKIPRDLKVRGSQRKFILRSVALSLGLDERIALKPKKASQYSSGLKDLVEKVARREGKRIYQFIRDL